MRPLLFCLSLLQFHSFFFHVGAVIFVECPAAAAVTFEFNPIWFMDSRAV